MSLTLPQLIALRHFYWKQMMAEIKASSPGPKQTHEQATHGWEQFRKGLIHG